MQHRLAAFILALGLLPTGALAECRQALALGLDVSGSVDLREYRLQIDGLIAALDDPDVVRLLLSTPTAPVSVLVYEWSGAEDHAVIVPWTSINGLQELSEIRATLAQAERRVTTPGTALGEAMKRGVAHLSDQDHCWKETLDISGDGKSNLGPRPRDVKEASDNKGITLNALVVAPAAPVSEGTGANSDELSSYFRAEVIFGPGAFVETAFGYEDYAAAMTRKLKRELEGRVIGAVQ